MKIDFTNMANATFPFNFVRALMVAGTGGAELSECLLVADRIKNNNIGSWIREWAAMAEQVAQSAEKAMQAGQTVTARQAYLRASNYYRTATFYLPHTDARLDKYLTLTREYFQKAARLFSPPIEVLAIPFETARLPGYFLSAGQPKRPTLIAVNGADSSNEELVHWIGFAAVARGWNCLVFEGPGQWSALQLNPGLLLRPDYEAPVKAVVDYLLQRPEVAPDQLALIGYSLGGVLAARVAAFEKRISAYICSGLVVDVSEAWIASMPNVLRKAPPAIFDSLFAIVEKISPREGALFSHFKWMMGVSQLREVIDGWRPFSLKGLAPKIDRPLLLIGGEEEYAQVKEKVIGDVLQFLSEVPGPVAFHQFDYEDGWAGSHCQIGALSQAQAVVFDWLDQTVCKKECRATAAVPYDWHVLNKYLPHRSRELDQLEKSLKLSVDETAY